MKILFVCSTGGHLGQLYKLRPWWEAHERAWVTFDDPHSLAIRILRAYRPDVVISDGAGVAFPFFLVARVIGIRTAYLEVFDRITRPTMTGRLCYPIAELFLLQWPEQVRHYPRGRVIGCLL